MKRKTMRDLAEALRDEMYMQDRIINALKEGPKTVPEMAEELGCLSPEVMKWVMAMRRYGKVIDIPKRREDNYYHYELAQG